MKPSGQTRPVTTGASGAFPLPVVRAPDPIPAWIAARPIVRPAPLAGEAVTPAGVEDGYAEGMRRAEQALAAERARLAAALAAVADLRATVMRDAEPQIVEIALAVARELLLRPVECERDLATRLAMAALEELGRGARVVLRVCAADRADVEEWLSVLPAEPAQPEVAVVEDAGLGPGDVVADTDQGHVDARFQSRFARVARALREGEVQP
jgi:flagellar assembly protein FliH